MQEAAAGVHDFVASDLGTTVVSSVAVGGGCINRAECLRLADGRRIFVKSSGHAPAGSFAAEASGLRWLRDASAIGVPAVLGAGRTWLALEWIDAGRPGVDSEPRLGRELAALHASGASCFGASPKGSEVPARSWLAGLPLDNEPCDTWADFYAERRLRPLVRRCRDAGEIDRELSERLEALLARVPLLVGDEEPPARLHGDLWGGNLIFDAAGRPWLVDPAPYGGHREMDLAMMRLFGGFGAQVFDAYREANPLSPGWRDRVPLHQLFPLLVHVALFGTSYVASLESVLSRFE